MRVYKFLDARFGLKSLCEKRLKISKLDDLNDPFELLPYDIRNKGHRRALYATKKELEQNRGLLCFSATWRNPVIWAHYADKHKGLCLGFEAPDDRARQVKYVSKRLPFPLTPKPANATAMLFTKYRSWSYEREIRIWAELNDVEDGLYYAEFGDTLRLVEVIVGARSPLARSDITLALGPLKNQVTLIKARAGFTEFEIVVDRRFLKSGW